MVFGLRHPDDVFEHQRGVGEQRPPRIGDHLDIGQHVGRRQPPQPLREIERVGGRDRIAVHHLQRIAALDDVDARQRAPGAADRIEGAAAAGLELGDAGESRCGRCARRASAICARDPAAPGCRAAASRRCARGCRGRRSVRASRRRDRRRCRRDCGCRKRRRARTVLPRAGRTGFRSGRRRCARPWR